jgi:hypothetical protein
MLTHRPSEAEPRACALLALPCDVAHALLDALWRGVTGSATLPGLVALAQLAMTCRFFRGFVAEHETDADAHDFRRAFNLASPNYFRLQACLTKAGTPAGKRIYALFDGYRMSAISAPARPAGARAGHFLLVRRRRSSGARPVELLFVFTRAGAGVEPHPIGVRLKWADMVRFFNGVCVDSVVSLAAPRRLTAARSLLDVRVPVVPGKSCTPIIERKPPIDVHFRLSISDDGLDVVRNMLLTIPCVADSWHARPHPLAQHGYVHFKLTTPHALALLLGAAEPVHAARVRTASDDAVIGEHELRQHLRAPPKPPLLEPARPAQCTALVRARRPAAAMRALARAGISMHNVIPEGRRRRCARVADARARAYVETVENIGSDREEDEDEGRY